MVGGVDEDVPRLHVAVHEPSSVGRVERLGDLADKGERSPGRKRPLLLEDGAQIAAVHVAGGEVELAAACLAGRVDREDPGMIERGRKARLAQEALAEASDRPRARARSASARRAGRARARSRGRRPPCRRGRRHRRSGSRPAGFRAPVTPQELDSRPFERPGEARQRRRGRDPARSESTPYEHGGRGRRGHEGRSSPPEPFCAPALGQPENEEPCSLGELGDAVLPGTAEQGLGDDSGRVLDDERSIRQQTAGIAVAGPSVGGADEA